MLVIVHVIVGIIATGASLGAIFRVAHDRSAKGFIPTALVGTIMTAVSGIGLIIDGSSVARVCAEAVALVALTFWAVVYSRRNQTIEEKI